MGQDDAAAVRECFDAWNRGERDRWMATLAADVDWRADTGPSGPDRDVVYHGRAEMWAFWDEWRETWDFRLEADEIRDVGSHALVVGRGVIPRRLEVPVTWVMSFADGQITRAHAYSETEEALAALGASE